MNKKQQRAETLFRTRNAVRILLFGEYPETRIDQPHNNPAHEAFTTAGWLCESLYKIERTLHRWHELECGADGGCIEQDETTGKWTLRREIGSKEYTRPIADREKGALRRLVNLLEPFKDRAAAFVQSDPRGAALYLYDPRKFTTQHIDNNSADAICICNRF